MVEDIVEAHVMASRPQKLVREQSFECKQEIALQDMIAIEQQNITEQGNNTNQVYGETNREKDKQQEKTKPEKELETQHKTIVTENGPKQDKQQKKRIKTEKTENTEKTETDETLNPAQSKYHVSFRGRMRPDDSIRHHPAFPLLFKYATEGCPVNCGEPWTREHLEAAINRGPHISARSPEAVSALREEAMEKVQQGYVEK